jgi:Rieske Fe-S protein
MYKSNSKIIKLSIITLSFILILGCRKDDGDVIPDVYVNITINILTDPEFVELKAPGNSEIVTHSSVGLTSLGNNDNGIIIYNAGDGFYAFDRTCTHDFPGESIAVELVDHGSTAKCPVCGSVYVLPSDGLPTLDGPAIYPLKNYSTYYNPNTGELQVYN